MKSVDPFETGRMRREARDRREKAALEQLNTVDVELLKTVLARLPLSDFQRERVHDAAERICFSLAMSRQELSEQRELLPELRDFTRASDRKPLARVVTDEAAEWFWLLTKKPVTRVSKYVAGRLGAQEAGDFAKFLGEVFAVLRIEASPAAQVKMWKKRRVADEAFYGPRIHPDDFWNIVNSPDALEMLLGVATKSAGSQSQRR